MADGASLLKLARGHIGEQYVNRQVPKDDKDWKGPWDCAEFMSWLVYQASGKLYGCTDNSAAPASADAYTGAWKRDAEVIGRKISVAEAVSTVGAFLLRYPPSPGTMGHIALSDGRGGTVEAAGRALGVIVGKANGRRWDTGVLVPWITYGASTGTVSVNGPAVLYAEHQPNMDPAKVRVIQSALKSRGFDPGEIDGEFGPNTAKAVSAFQRAEGLIEDGEVGDQTAEKLGIGLIAAPAAPAAKPSAAEGAASIVLQGGALNPLIGIAAAVLPEIIKSIASDRGGSVIGNVVKAVTQVAGTSDPAAAQEKIKADPAAASALQVKLAEIAVEQERVSQQNQLELLKLQLDQQSRAAQANLDNTKDARQAALELARIGGPNAFGPMFVTVSVIAGFFLFLFLLFIGAKYFDFTKDSNVFQIINITVGALTAAFATVVNFWLGSSQGSRAKDLSNATLQVQQAQQAKDIIQSQAAVVEAVQKPAPATSPVAGGPKRSNFQKCVDLVLVSEGGYVDNPADPGGATNMGITIATLRTWRSDDKLTPHDVKNLTREEACEIYRTKYWNVLRCDDLPVGVDLVTFDLGVNAGPGRSARTLQKAVGAEADGSIGPATIAAAKVANPIDTIQAFTVAKLDFYKSLSTWDTFGRGWTNRAQTVQREAIAMAQHSGSA